MCLLGSCEQFVEQTPPVAPVPGPAPGLGPSPGPSPVLGSGPGPVPGSGLHTALHRAAAVGCSRTVAALIQGGCAVDLQDKVRVKGQR